MKTSEAAKVLVEHWITIQTITGCLNCICYKEPTNFCERYKVNPPGKVILFGCNEGWEGDIPF